MDITNNRFFAGLDKVAEKMNKNKFLSAYQASAAITMGIILVGAVFSILSTILNMAGVIELGDSLYNMINLPNTMTMGLLTLVIAFGIGYNYASKLSLNPLQNGIASLICFLLVAAPATTVITADGIAFTGLSTTNMGAAGMFVAMIIAFTVVRINYICVKNNIVIKMPDVVPPALSNGFSSALPLFFAVSIWYGLSIVCTHFSGGTMDIPTLIGEILRAPLSGVNSIPGVLVLAFLQAAFWFVGVHGAGILTPITFPLIMVDVATNAALLAEGQPPVFTPMMALQMTSVLGGTGNVWALELLGLRSKSEKIKSVSRAAVVTGAFSIGEPAFFGYPIMYNPLLGIGLVLANVVPVILALVLGSLGLLPPYITFIYAIIPFNLHHFFCTGFDIRALIFDICLIPICMICYYPFYKLYEKNCIEEEREEAELLTAEGN
jgi:PTS system cellobiose-specific IIC component